MPNSLDSWGVEMLWPNLGFPAQGPQAGNPWISLPQNPSTLSNPNSPIPQNFPGAGDPNDPINSPPPPWQGPQQTPPWQGPVQPQQPPGPRPRPMGPFNGGGPVQVGGAPPPLQGTLINGGGNIPQMPPGFGDGGGGSSGGMSFPAGSSGGSVPGIGGSAGGGSQQGGGSFPQGGGGGSGGSQGGGLPWDSQGNGGQMGTGANGGIAGVQNGNPFPVGTNQWLIWNHNNPSHGHPSSFSAASPTQQPQAPGPNNGIVGSGFSQFGNQNLPGSQSGGFGQPLGQPSMATPSSSQPNFVSNSTGATRRQFSTLPRA